MIKVVFWDNVPNSTYFLTGDVEPEVLEDNSVRLFSGHGRSRSWGRPGVTSVIVLHSDDFLAVLIGFYHKHHGSQFWRYFQEDADGNVNQHSWRELSTAQKMAVLEAYDQNAPS